MRIGALVQYASLMHSQARAGGAIAIVRDGDQVRWPPATLLHARQHCNFYSRMRYALHIHIAAYALLCCVHLCGAFTAVNATTRRFRLISSLISSK